MTGLGLQLLPWITTAAVLLCAVSAVSVLAARALFNVALAVAALCASAATALVSLGQGEGAVVFASLGVAIAPVLLLGGTVLSGRAVKPRTAGAPWLTILAATAAAVAMLWAVPSLEITGHIASPRAGVPIALPALVFAAVAACVAALGYGERGLLGGKIEDRGE